MRSLTAPAFAQRRHLRLAIAGLPLVLLVPPWRQFIEGSMPLHMLLEFPMLLASGAATGGWLHTAAPALSRKLAQIDTLGLLGSTCLLLVSAFWMVPAALDLALLDARYAAFKYLGWWIVGALLALGWTRYSPVVALFTYGNLAWMAASAGILYQSIEIQLCVSYLPSEQVWTGYGLIVLALLLGPWVLLRDGARCFTEAAATALPPSSGRPSTSLR